jgi:hypothetical protein
LKWVAEYGGTSVEMIKKSDGTFTADDGAVPLMGSLFAEGEVISATDSTIFGISRT